MREVGGSSPPLPTKLDLLYLAQPQVCYAEAKRRLMGCYGVEDKMEAFPVDVWVERAMPYYLPCQEQPIGNELVMWAQNHFGKYAGYANQMLFHERYAASVREPPSVANWAEPGSQAPCARRRKRKHRGNYWGLLAQPMYQHGRPMP